MYTFTSDTERLRAAAPVVPVEDAEAGVFEAVAASFDSIANGERGPTRFASTAFDASVKAKPLVPLQWMHDDTAVIGSASLRVERTVGLMATCKLSLGVGRAREAYALLRDGAVGAVSIGFMPLRSHTATEDGQAIRVVDVATVYELSVVSWPADEQAKVKWVHSATGASVCDPFVRARMAWDAVAIEYKNPAAREMAFYRTLARWSR
jgi:HK97 family phage prohead protease